MSSEIVRNLEILDQLGRMDYEELLTQFTSANVESMRFISSVLKDEMPFERVLSQGRFTEIVAELYETKNLWSSRLDETLAGAEKEMKQGNKVQALWILNGFIRFCSSPLYREMAQVVMEEYESQ